MNAKSAIATATNFEPKPMPKENTESKAEATRVASVIPSARVRVSRL